MPEPVEYSADLKWSGSVSLPSATVLLASGAIPVRPPKDWFTNPQFDRVSPLHVEADGRVRGHIAAWESNHIGMVGQIKPPKSKAGYAYFRTGQLETAEGEMVPVGQITLTGGHAPLKASAQDAVKHYDDTNSAIMDVAVGEDAHGIWVAGALRPDVDELRLRKIRASGVSGDWRPINGNLELVAVCAVNVPGFPIPRAMAASAVNESTNPEDIEILALVAAGTETLSRLAITERAVLAAVEAVADIEERLEWVKDALSALNPEDLLSESDPAPEAVSETPEVADEAPEVSDESEEADPEVENATETSEEAPETPGDEQEASEAAPAADEAPEAAEEPALELDARTEAILNGSLDREDLADAVYRSLDEDLAWEGDDLPIVLSLDQCESIALRMRFRKGNDSISVDARRDAARSGEAMADGRFPILDESDLRVALRAAPAGPAGDEIRAHINRRAKALGVEI